MVFIFSNGHSDVRKIAKEQDSQEVKDALFVKYFEDEDLLLYKEEKEYIITSAPENWRQQYINCFETIEDGRHTVVIPTFITAIEHEISAMQESSILLGRRLLKNTQSSTMENTDNNGKFSNTIGLSVIGMLLNGMFENHPFNEESKLLINRNWILHGRDNPEKWTMVDVYRLMSIISALRIIRS